MYFAAFISVLPWGNTFVCMHACTYIPVCISCVCSVQFSCKKNLFLSETFYTFLTVSTYIYIYIYICESLVACTCVCIWVYVHALVCETSRMNILDCRFKYIYIYIHELQCGVCMRCRSSNRGAGCTNLWVYEYELIGYICTWNSLFAEHVGYSSWSFFFQKNEIRHICSLRSFGCLPFFRHFCSRFFVFFVLWRCLHVKLVVTEYT